MSRNIELLENALSDGALPVKVIGKGKLRHRYQPPIDSATGEVPRDIRLQGSGKIRLIELSDRSRRNHKELSIAGLVIEIEVSVPVIVVERTLNNGIEPAVAHFHMGPVAPLPVFRKGSVTYGAAHRAKVVLEKRRSAENGRGVIEVQRERLHCVIINAQRGPGMEFKKVGKLAVGLPFRDRSFILRDIRNKPGELLFLGGKNVRDRIGMDLQGINLNGAEPGKRRPEKG